MKAVLLDRDGTILEDRGYVTAPEMIAPLPGAAEAIIKIRERGWKALLVTNQGQVAKGLITEDELTIIHQRLVMMLGAEGAMLDGIYYCPHHPEGTDSRYAGECSCRKPRPGMIERAASEHDLELSECVMIGDTVRDIKAAKTAGVGTTILVLTGYGEKSALEEHGADHVAKDLPAAVEWLLSK